jgi:hypothetical protein
LQRNRHALTPGLDFSRRRIEFLDARCRKVSEIERWFDQHLSIIDSYVESPLRSGPAAFESMGRSFTVATLCRQTMRAVGKEPTPIVSVGPELRSTAKELLELLPSTGSPVSTAFERLPRF